ncbi:MAG: sigma-54 dependent transcriptional regulator [Candidatus Poribacteria bacterium]|nr:sigma-54 dependent transcriptional regulator [Candidatus Poribacteria bacterium]
MKKTILIVDDEENIHFAFQRVLGETYDLIKATSGEEGMRLIQTESPDLVILDIKLPGISGLDALVKIRENFPLLPVIVMTAFSTTRYTIEAMKLGAYEYFTKPPEMVKMRQSIEQALQDAEQRQETTRSGAFAVPSAERTEETDNLIGSSPEMQEVYKMIGRVAETDVTVMITGESGTGKDLVARAIWKYGPRKSKLMMPVNCAAIPENLLESELFGHEKGSFTGADRLRIGRFEECDGGTIFLDEIGDMPIALQAKLLRVLQDGEFNRVGGQRPIRVDVRIIAATNKKLLTAVERGQFREDLFYRLNVVTIHLPPLRERTGDVPELVNYFLSRFSKEAGKKIELVGDDVMTFLASYPWPGNVRELENTLRRALLLSRGGTITRSDLKLSGEIQTPVSEPMEEMDAETLLMRGFDDIFRNPPEEGVLTHVERLLLTRTLEHLQGNQKRAAELLGIARNTLRSKMERYNISKDVRITRTKE